MEVITLRSALLLHLIRLLAVLILYMPLFVICVRVLRPFVIAFRVAGLLSSTFVSRGNTFSSRRACLQRGLVPEASFSFSRSIIVLAVE